MQGLVIHVTSHNMKEQITLAPLDPSILRAYDIRGIVGQTLHEHDAYAIGCAFATYLKTHHLGSTVCIGRDGRETSPMLVDALMNGLNVCGVDVIDIGVGPTPMLYFAVKHLACDAGIMVTGSHNPPSHNGFKFMLQHAPFFGDDIQALGDIIPNVSITNDKGRYSKKDIESDYVKAICAAYEAGPNDLKIAWDAGNGAAGEVMQAVCKQLAGTHILLNETIDGTFPNHHPDPTIPENLEQLIETVCNQQCDFGIAFDGDGDRVGVVDGEGNIVWGDQLMVLFSRDVLQELSGSTIIADVKASQVLFDEIANAGGNPLMWKTGHSLIKAKMAETKAPLAGEMSGHIFFADKYYGYDDGIYAAIRLVDIAAKSKQSISEMVAKLPKPCNTPELRIDCDESRKFAIIDEVTKRLETSNADFNNVDGVRVLTENGWWLLRASNTQAALVARCEAHNEEALTAVKNDLIEQLAASDILL